MLSLLAIRILPSFLYELGSILLGPVYMRIQFEHQFTNWLS